MNKYITLMLLILGNFVFSQVGIATDTPNASSDLDLGATNRALYLNRVADPENDIVDPQSGMMLYDTTEHCVKVYGGDPAKWSDCLGKPAGTVSTIDCNAALSPVAVAGVISYNGSFTVAYTEGNGGTYEAQTLTSTPAGFTATLAAGNFSNGSGSVTYSVTAATVPAVGSYTFDITLGGQTCTKTITVAQNPIGVLPPNITLSQNRRHWIASVYDTDYLPYTTPTTAASIAVVNADSTPDAVTVDYQGSITTTGITVQIPVATVTGTGNIQAWTSTFVVPAMYAEDGESRTLELSWAAQTFTNSSKFITATIKSLGGTFNAKKLDINAGIGNDYLGLLLGAFQYPYNNAGTLTSYEVRDIPGIPDRMFGKPDGAGDTTTHLMLYLPVQTPDGSVFLNNNLGADYANLNSPSFNLAQQATSIAMDASDPKAKGSFFQWGRAGDGHELMTWTSSSQYPTPVYSIASTTTSTKSDVPNHRYFIKTPLNPRDWRVNSNPDLWNGENAVNNPCPHGFRVPHPSERGIIWAANTDVLKIPSVRGRNGGGDNSYNNATQGYSRTVWSDYVMYGTNPGTYADAERIGNNASTSGFSMRSEAYPVRCIQD